MFFLLLMLIQIPEVFEPAFFDQSRFQLLQGGRGSGKTEYIGRKHYYRCETEGNHQFVMLRKVRNTCKKSIVKVMTDILEENSVKFDYHKTDLDITFKNSKGQNNLLIFGGMDDPAKWKGLKGTTGVWMEEAAENSLKDFIDTNMLLRGKTKHYKQMLLSYNPDESTGGWIKKRFFIEKKKNPAFRLKTTVYDNPFIDKEYIEQLEALEDPVLREIYLKGNWAVFKGQIYTHIKQVDEFPETFDKVYYGLDFGYNNPCALVKVGVKDQVHYWETILHQSKMTNGELIERIKSFRVKNGAIYCDSAEPARIAEMKKAGLNAIPAEKSVKDGILYVKKLQVNILSDDEHLNDEARLYKWKQKGEDLLDEPVKAFDHCLDAVRYAEYTESLKMKIKTTGIYIPKTSQLRGNFV